MSSTQLGDSQKTVIDRKEMEAHILWLCHHRKEGLNQEQIISYVPGLSFITFVQLARKLLREGHIEPYLKYGKLLYRGKPKPQPKIIPKVAKLPKRTGRYEKMIYLAIKKSGSNGLTIPEIRARLRLGIIMFKPIVDSLDKKRYIKSYFLARDEKVRKTRVYVSAAIIPATYVIDGSLCRDLEIESKYVNELMAKIIEFTKTFPFMTKCEKDCPSVYDFSSPYLHDLANSGKIYDHLLKNGISTDILTYPAFEKLLETMVHDGKIHVRTMTNGQNSDGIFKKPVEKKTTVTLGVSEISSANCKVSSL
ncbi:DNA-directed RNA polymerase III subunit RPC6 [Thelohanellus kitauei]|uniref:DNA-directed RNA polymerase III subunit RPC6 n=1 Tax=Thelohanellus kitauei TaxID=669202 RepID=A0A0C2JNN8_THEKT|nr:DNA-directed RNA polymerase III subunit RPC6 [Thelohanellus kitauei]